MMNPNGDDLTRNEPATGSTRPHDEEGFPEPKKNLRRRVSDAAASAGDVAGRTWQSTSSARERTEFFLRENPVPTILGALMVGLAIGLAIRYASGSSEKEIEVKTPLGRAHLSAASLPLLWPFIKGVKRRYEDSADALKEGVDRIKEIDVDRYVKPLRKRWKTWLD